MDMPPFNNQPSPNDSSVKDWFNTIDAGTPLTPPPPSGPSMKRRLLIGALVTLFVLAATAGTLSALGVNLFSTAPACLSKDDYKILTGDTADEQLSPQSFYTTSFDFTNNTANFVEGAQSDAESQTKIIAEFYQTYGTKRSVVVTISSDAAENDSLVAAAKRIQMLKDLLIKSGVDELAIQTIKPVTVDSSGELSGDSLERVNAKAYINVASVADCR
jgi:hypothetical protein